MKLPGRVLRPLLERYRSFAAYDYGQRQFAIFRGALGVYLAVNLAHHAVYARELYGPARVLGEFASRRPRFPNVFGMVSDDFGAQGVLWVGSVLAILFAAGVLRRATAIALYYVGAAASNWTFMTFFPMDGYVGWLLLASVLVPIGEPTLFRRRTSDGWQLPGMLFFGVWLLLGVGYTLSGVGKLNSFSWIHGDAIVFALQMPVAYETALRDLLLALPPVALRLLTWLMLFGEVAFLPFALFQKTRPFAWLIMMCMHTGLLLLLNIPQITLAFMLVHLFAFDYRWVDRFKLHRQRAAGRDVARGARNAESIPTR